MTTRETWRVVDGLGGVREVPVRVEGELLLVGPGPVPRWYGCSEPPRLALMHYALTMHWPLAEILAPGDLTAEERVAAERARCAEVCRKVAAKHWAIDSSGYAAECADTIGRGEAGR